MTLKRFFNAMPRQNGGQNPLHKNVLHSGERIVRVSTDGKPSETLYKVVESFENASLIEAMPITGRTHQIRVHCQVKGHPIAGDNKYGHEDFDDEMKTKGLKRLFLHAASIEFTHPLTQQRLKIEAPLEPSLEKMLKNLTKAN